MEIDGIRIRTHSEVYAPAEDSVMLAEAVEEDLNTKNNETVDSLSTSVDTPSTSVDSPTTSVDTLSTTVDSLSTKPVDRPVYMSTKADYKHSRKGGQKVGNSDAYKTSNGQERGQGTKNTKPVDRPDYKCRHPVYNCRQPDYKAVDKPVHMSTKADYLPVNKMLEIGTGTGFIAIYLSKLAKGVIAVDINKKAVETAIKNVKENGISNIKVLESDMFGNVASADVDRHPISVDSLTTSVDTLSTTVDSLTTKPVDRPVYMSTKAAGRVDYRNTKATDKDDYKFDVIVFNPPYLPVSEKGELEKAWAGGEGGIGPLITFLKQAKKHLNKNGKIYFIVSSICDIDKLQDFISGEKYAFEVIKTKKIAWETLMVYRLRAK